MSAKWVYLALAVIGAVIPMSIFLPWAWENGLAPGAFLAALNANPISRFFAWDLLISGLAALVWISVEARRRPVPHAWLAALGTLCVGVSFGLPLYLYLRERSRRKS